MKEYNIRELRPILNSTTLGEVFQVKCDGKILGMFIPTKEALVTNQLLNGLIDNVIALEKTIGDLQFPQTPLESPEPLFVPMVRCEQPGCSQKTANPRREVTFDYESRSMILCDMHWKAANIQ